MKKIEKNIELEKVVKAVYKSILKTYQRRKRKKESQDIVQDILDENYVAEVDPDEIPPVKNSVINKSVCKICGLEGCKCSKSREKGINKLKKMCKKIKDKKINKDEPIPGLYQK